MTIVKTYLRLFSDRAGNSLRLAKLPGRDCLARCPPRAWRCLPHFEADQGILNRALVELHHVGVHVVVVAPNVPLRAAVRDGPKAEGWVLLLGLLELGRNHNGKVWSCLQKETRRVSLRGAECQDCCCCECSGAPLETFFPKGSWLRKGFRLSRKPPATFAYANI